MSESNHEQMPMSELRTPEAEHLGDLSLIVLDLRSTIDICRRLLEELRKEVQDAVLIEALWTSALVKYARCFASGKRFGLDEKIFEHFDGDPIGAHRYFIGMRNKHVAHSVNPFEEVRVGVVLSPPSAQPLTVQGIAVLSRKLISTDVDGVGNLITLTSTLQKRVGEDRLLKWAQGRPVENFPQGQLGMFTPDPDHVGKARGSD